jgi:hypothetical protein
VPKYYVCSGDLRIIIARPEPETAALDALKTLDLHPVKRLSNITVVSEHGFPGSVTKDDDTIFTTLDLLEELDLLDKFKPEDWT